ncbi:DUF5694 domain-containing protein [Halobacillus mangrovi]|uniref:Haem-binding uptake Tiki superfamily ChaN domain-containing protein n=1 Tax=Halobacillus mangrovi TaxID=402384 RepID=A0A1W5ZYI8_9BACI|nr:DUF5694 domain-containing protein [Halobacillus mangrovi]ARI78352.1 hypothetical protein HM131_16585 [Halobacillus mangrovi]
MSKAVIMLMGTFHMAMDPNKINEHQEQIQSIVHRLKEFKPTKIAVEKSFLIEEELDRKYSEFLNGNLVPAYDEVEQFAFRLASHFDHPKVYPVDEIVDMSSPSLEQVFEWTKEHQRDLFQEIMRVQRNLQTFVNDTDVYSTLQYLNDPQYSRELQRVYMKLSRVGDRQHQIGVSWLTQWHKRDLAMAANIARLANSEDRVLVLVGGDHLHLLERFLKDSGDFELQSVLPFVQKT